MKKKRGKEGFVIKINLTNRWLYTLIALGILAIIGTGVYALAPGVAPNPGHLIDNVAPPDPCSDGQVLGWDGTAWTCVDDAVGSVVDTNTYCSASGSTITCPDATTLTDTTIANTYCSASGSTITCPDATTLTDTTIANTDYCAGGTCGGGLTVTGNAKIEGDLTAKAWLTVEGNLDAPGNVWGSGGLNPGCVQVTVDNGLITCGDGYFVAGLYLDGCGSGANCEIDMFYCCPL